MIETRNVRRLWVFLALACLLAVPGAMLGQKEDIPRFTVTDLGPFEAVAISEDGQVAGKDYGDLPWVWRNGVRTQLGVKGSATAINGKGHVVGSRFTGEYYPIGFGEFAPIQHAFLWQDGEVIDLGTFGGWNSHASSINDSDQVIGVAADSSQESGPFLWQNGVMTLLRSRIPAASDWRLEAALRITDDGRIFGIGLVQGARRVYQLTPRLDGSYSLIDLGPLTNLHFSLTAFNKLGWASGNVLFLGTLDLQAVLWREGTLTPLGNLGSPASYGRGINDHGHVVGLSNSSSYRAFLWRDGMINDLNSRIAPDSGWVLVDAQAINNSGQIAGHGMFGTSHRAFLLNPVSNPSKTFRLILRLPPYATEEVFYLEAENVPASEVSIEVSSDLSHWNALANTGSSTNTTWTIPKDGTDGSPRFFRAVTR